MVALVLVEDRFLVAERFEELRALRAVAMAAFPDERFPRIILVACQEQQLAFELIEQLSGDLLEMIPQEGIQHEDRAGEFLESRIEKEVHPLMPRKEIPGTENAEMKLVEIPQIEGIEMGKSALGDEFERLSQIERCALRMVIRRNVLLNRRNSSSRHDNFSPLNEL